MDVRKLLEEVKRGDTSIEEAENAFKNLPYEDLGYAKLDLHRKLRSGFPETVFCQGKPDAYLADIFETLYRENGEVLGTRATPEPALDIGRKSNRYNKNCQPSNNNNKEKWFRTLLHFTFLYEIYAASKNKSDKDRK